MEQMKCLFGFFENADELAYVCDEDSLQLLYMNRKAREAYGIKSREELSGRKCDASFYGGLVPMPGTGTEKPGGFIELKYFNPTLSRHFLLIRTSAIEDDGRRTRFELAIDITDIEESRRTLDWHDNLEACVNRGIRRAILEQDPDISLMIILEFLGQAIHGERAYIYEKNQNGHDCNTYEWTAQGIKSEIENLQDIPPEICDGWYRAFADHKYIVFDDVEKLRADDPLRYEHLKSHGIHSGVVVPLYNGNQVVGFYGVANLPAHNLEYTLNMLQIVGHFISSMLKRRDNMRELKHMSYSDQLTKLGNRHAMGEYISSMSGEGSLGIVYCDITGLKKVNDEFGHEKGDELIISASESLRKAFEGYGLFRIGGDELLAICQNISEDSLQERLEKLREEAKKAEVNLAIGSVWKSNYENNLQKLVSVAEKLMYMEKSEFYRLSGIDRRR